MLLAAALLAFDVCSTVFMVEHAHAQTLDEPSQRGYVVADPVRPDGIGLALVSGRWAVSKGDNCANTSIAPGQNVDLWMLTGFAGVGVVAPLMDDGTPDMANSCDVRFEQLADPTPCLTTDGVTCDVAAEQ